MQESLSKSDEIKNKLAEFESNIDSYRTSLNSEGVWLFLATLGCWSVNHGGLKIFAIGITFLLFTHRIFTKMHDKRTFPSISKELERTIRSEIEEEDTQKARLHDLTQIRTIKLSIFNHLKSTAIFIICYAFLAGTIWNWYETYIINA